MHLQSVHIQNIKSIQDFRMDFPEPGSGWHVVIGDNGAGKTGLLQAIAACLCGPGRFPAFRFGAQRLLRKGCEEGSVSVQFFQDMEDESRLFARHINGKVTLSINLKEGQEGIFGNAGHDSAIWKGTRQYFSASFGPFRRLEGGNSIVNKLFDEDHRAAAHVSLFEPEAAFVKVEDWLKDLKFKELESKNNQPFSESIIRFLNQEGMLPNDFKVKSISSDGLTMLSPTGQSLSLSGLSDGYRSVLSLMLELIRQMRTIFFLPEKGFPDFFVQENAASPWVVDLPGVVMIDEVDAHLHPSWQTQIGKWLTTYFPRIQFIVTTHSPLVCRSAEKGTIWQLAAPGSGEESRQITGVEYDRLIYGNILDAYGTEVFGDNVTVSEVGFEKREELARLNKKSFKGTISDEEKQALDSLRSILPTGN